MSLVLLPTAYSPTAMLVAAATANDHTVHVHSCCQFDCYSMDYSPSKCQSERWLSTYFESVSDNNNNDTADDDWCSSIDSISLSLLRPSYSSPSSINNVIWSFAERCLRIGRVLLLYLLLDYCFRLIPPVFDSGGYCVHNGITLFLFICYWYIRRYIMIKFNSFAAT